MYDTGEADRHGKPRLAYEFFDVEYGPQPIFSGADFFASPLDPIDSDATLAAALSFFSLRPGDTDEEYFAGYSERQFAWWEEMSFLPHKWACFDPNQKL